MNRHSVNSSSDKMRLKRSDQPGSMNRFIGNNSSKQMRLRKSVMQDLMQCITALQKHKHWPRHKSTTMPTRWHSRMTRLTQQLMQTSAEWTKSAPTALLKSSRERPKLCAAANGKVVLEPSPALPPLLKNFSQAKVPSASTSLTIFGRIMAALR